MAFTNRSPAMGQKRAISRELLLERERLATNGLGGFASWNYLRCDHPALSWSAYRRACRHHHGRMVMWSHVSEFLRFGDDDVVSLGAKNAPVVSLISAAPIICMNSASKMDLPVWTYHVRDLVLEKRILMLHLQNTVHVIYRILEGEKRPRLELQPAFFFRHYESPVNRRAGLRLYRLERD